VFLSGFQPTIHPLAGFRKAPLRLPAGRAKKYVSAIFAAHAYPMHASGLAIEVLPNLQAGRDEPSGAAKSIRQQHHDTAGLQRQGGLSYKNPAHGNQSSTALA
jgi:hypothetical protein